MSDAVDEVLALDLMPRGHVVVDLMGISVAADYAPYGCSHSTHLPERFRVASKAATDLAGRLARRMRTRAELALALRHIIVAEDVVHPAAEKLHDLRIRFCIRLYDRWFPRLFVNEGVLRPDHGPHRFRCYPGCYVAGAALLDAADRTPAKFFRNP